MTDYISIQEFANKSGLSRQTVYRKLDTEWNKYYKEENGKKLISIEALAEVLKSKSENEIPKKYVSELHMSLCNNLMEQIKAKDTQIKELTQALISFQNSEAIKSLTTQLKAKDEQINALTEALKTEQNISSQAHMLHAGTMQTLPEKTNFFSRVVRLIKKDNAS